MAKREEWARWLEKDGEHRLFDVDALDDARKDGWKEPESVRGNGEPWNPPVHDGEGLPQAESLAKVQEAAKDVEAKKAKRLNAEAESAMKPQEEKPAVRKGK